MQDKIIEILSDATGWMQANQIAEIGGWRSAANVGVALAQMEKSGITVRRKSPTEKMHNGMPATEWRHVDKKFADKPASKTTEASGKLSETQRKRRQQEEEQPLPVQAVKALEKNGTAMPTDKECCNAAKVVATTAGAEVSALNETINALQDDIRRQVQRAEAAEANRNDLKKRVELLEADVTYKAGVIDEYKSKLGYVQQQNEALQEQLLGDDAAVDVKDAAKGFLIRTPSQAPQFRSKYSSAQATALTSARRHGQAEVLALIPVGKAIRGAEWKASA